MAKILQESSLYIESQCADNFQEIFKGREECVYKLLRVLEESVLVSKDFRRVISQGYWKIKNGHILMQKFDIFERSSCELKQHMQKYVTKDPMTNVIVQPVYTCQTSEQELDKLKYDTQLFKKFMLKLYETDTEYLKDMDQKYKFDLTTLLEKYSTLLKNVNSIEVAIKKKDDFSASKKWNNLIENKNDIIKMMQEKIKESDKFHRENIRMTKDLRAKEQNLKEMTHRLSSLQKSEKIKEKEIEKSEKLVMNLKQLIAHKNAHIIKLEGDLQKAKASLNKRAAKCKKTSIHDSVIANQVMLGDGSTAENLAPKYESKQVAKLRDEICSLKHELKYRDVDISKLSSENEDLRRTVRSLHDQIISYTGLSACNLNFEESFFNSKDVPERKNESLNISDNKVAINNKEDLQKTTDFPDKVKPPRIIPMKELQEKISSLEKENSIFKMTMEKLERCMLCRDTCKENLKEKSETQKQNVTDSNYAASIGRDDKETCYKVNYDEHKLEVVQSSVNTQLDQEYKIACLEDKVTKLELNEVLMKNQAKENQNSLQEKLIVLQHQLVEKESFIRTLRTKINYFRDINDYYLYNPQNFETSFDLCKRLTLSNGDLNKIQEKVKNFQEQNKDATFEDIVTFLEENAQCGSKWMSLQIENILLKTLLGEQIALFKSMIREKDLKISHLLQKIEMLESLLVKKIVGVNNHDLELRLHVLRETMSNIKKNIHNTFSSNDLCRNEILERQAVDELQARTSELRFNKIKDKKLFIHNKIKDLEKKINKCREMCVTKSPQINDFISKFSDTHSS